MPARCSLCSCCSSATTSCSTLDPDCISSRAVPLATPVLPALNAIGSSIGRVRVIRTPEKFTIITIIVAIRHVGSRATLAPGPRTRCLLLCSPRRYERLQSLDLSHE